VSAGWYLPQRIEHFLAKKQLIEKAIRVEYYDSNCADVLAYLHKGVMPSKEQLDELYQVKAKSLEDADAYFAKLNSDPYEALKNAPSKADIHLVPVPQALKVYTSE